MRLSGHLFVPAVVLVGSSILREVACQNSYGSYGGSFGFSTECVEDCPGWEDLLEEGSDDCAIVKTWLDTTCMADCEEGFEEDVVDIFCTVTPSLLPFVRRHQNTVTAGETVAFFRFEHTIPAAFWRHELVYSDHSGYRNHLLFDETDAVSLAVNSLDGNPQSADCQSETGSGCTFLAYDGGYDTDKFARDDWVAYDGSYTISDVVPPQSMFNLGAAPK